MILTLITNELFGAISISLPFIVLYNMVSNYAFRWWFIALYALAVGLFLGWQTHKQNLQLRSNLQFVPTGSYKDAFDLEVERCGVSKETIQFRYAHTDNQVAMTVDDMIIIDPLIWAGIEDDVQATAAKSIIEAQLMPNIPQEKKDIQEKVREALSPLAQRFILRHELGHAQAHYSKRYCLTQGGIGFVASGLGLAVGSLLMPYSGLLACVAAIASGGSCDIILSYVRNAFFRAREEKQADLFAAQFSTPQEIEAAADFFEKHYEICDPISKDKCGLLTFLPAKALTGYPTKHDRSAYLRACAQQKKETEFC